MPALTSPAAPRLSEIPRRTAAVAAYLFLAGAVLLWLHAWYSTLNWGPRIYLPPGTWFVMLSSLILGLASAVTATCLAIRQGKESGFALVALAGASLLLVLFGLFAMS
jgi:hypothetical protein